MVDLPRIDDFPFRLSLEPRWSDVEPSCYISNVGLSRYYEDARIALIDYARGDAGIMTGERRIYLVRAVNKEFAFCEFSTPIEIGAGIRRIGRSSFIYSVCAFQKSKCVGVSEAVGAFVDGEGRPIPIPDIEKSVLRNVLLSNGDSIIGDERPSSELLLRRNYALCFTFTTRFSDTDVFAHVNNVAVVRYYEDGLARLLLEYYGNEYEFLSRPVWRIRLSDLVYLKELKYPGEVSVSIGVLENNFRNVVLAQALFQNERCIGVRKVILEFHSLAGEPMPVPEILKKRFDKIRILTGILTDSIE